MWSLSPHFEIIDKASEFSYTLGLLRATVWSFEKASSEHWDWQMKYFAPRMLCSSQSAIDKLWNVRSVGHVTFRNNLSYVRLTSSKGGGSNLASDVGWTTVKIWEIDNIAFWKLQSWHPNGRSSKCLRACIAYEYTYYIMLIFSNCISFCSFRLFFIYNKQLRTLSQSLYQNGDLEL